MSDEVPVDATSITEAERIFHALDVKHDDAYHIHAAECCWSFPGAIDTIASALAASPPDPRIEKVRAEFWRRGDPSTDGVWREACELLDEVVRAVLDGDPS